MQQRSSAPLQGRGETLPLHFSLMHRPNVEAVRAMLLVVAPSSPRVVLHLSTRSQAPPPIAASLAASASLAAAAPPAVDQKTQRFVK